MPDTPGSGMTSDVLAISAAKRLAELDHIVITIRDDHDLKGCY